jgi:hypothetical protein
MPNTFKTELDWHVYDGTNKPPSYENCIILTTSGFNIHPLIGSFSFGEWRLSAFESYPIKYGDVWAKLPTLSSFPNIKVTVKVEMKERS